MLNNDINKNALMAIEQNKPEILARYVHEMDLTLKDASGCTPIVKAAALKHWDCVKVIAKQRPIDAKVKEACFGSALLDVVYDNHIPTAALLLQIGSPTRWHLLDTKNQLTHCAVANNSPEMVALLLMYGVDHSEIKNKDEETPAALAKKLKNDCLEKGWLLAHTHKRRVELTIVFVQVLKHKTPNLINLQLELMYRIIEATLTVEDLKVKSSSPLVAGNFFNITISSAQARLMKISAEVKTELAIKTANGIITNTKCFLIECGNFFRWHIKSDEAKAFESKLTALINGSGVLKKSQGITKLIREFLQQMQQKCAESGLGIAESKTCGLLMKHGLVDCQLLAEYRFKPSAAEFKESGYSSKFFLDAPSNVTVESFDGEKFVLMPK